MWLEANDKWIDKLIIYRIPELKISKFIRHFFFMKDNQRRSTRRKCYQVVTVIKNRLDWIVSLVYNRRHHSRWPARRKRIIELQQKGSLLRGIRKRFQRNKLFPSCCLPLFQMKSWCKTFHMNMNGFTQRFALWQTEAIANLEMVYTLLKYK